MSVMESVGVATVTGNLAEREQECARDRVASLGFVDPLGAAMVRLLAGNDAAAWNKAIALLQKRSAAKFKCSTDMRWKLSESALREAVFSFCRACRGAKTVMRGDLKVQCPTCGGHGLHRYSDFERASSLGLSITSYRKGWVRRLDLTREVLESALGQALGGLKHQLER